MAYPAGAEKSAANKLFGLDFLRALAILLVFLFHYGGQFAHPEWVNIISKFGWTGVDLFFCIKWLFDRFAVICKNCGEQKSFTQRVFPQTIF
jgi:hypothetical protein